ncbi:MAG TPA: hypothetical protein VK524_10390 [Polyangiaceae bacterium]|nr:hypothetical protein [Polyangiaceae bacterium]
MQRPVTSATLKRIEVTASGNNDTLLLYVSKLTLVGAFTRSAPVFVEL